MRYRCGTCKLTKSENDFHIDRNNPRGRANRCKQCRKDFHQKRRANDPHYWSDRNNAWRIPNREHARQLNNNWLTSSYTKHKLKIIEKYGGSCFCCGIKEPHFLTIEHKNGVPEHHRWPNGKRMSGLALMKIIEKEGYPSDYGILCHNCNSARAKYGFCPHEEHEDWQRRYERVI